jgi:hypothetical protein
MRSLRAVVAERNAYRWAQAMLADAAELRSGRANGRSRQPVRMQTSLPEPARAAMIAAR